jgi:cell division protein FtsI/penicillin-binding protein 2
VTARSRERGSHAGQPRGYGLPRPAGMPRLPGVPPRGGTGDPDPQGAPGAAATHPGSGPGPVRPDGPQRSGASRHRKPPARHSRLSRRQRMAAVLVVVVGVLTIGFGTGFGAESSAEPTVQAFLLDWQQGNYAAAAALTTGDRTQVAAQLSAAYADLDASETFLSMRTITQHGNTAQASFGATVDLAEGSHQWTYTGRLGMIAKHGQWLVNWAPGVIDPSLGPGDRLAVVTTYSPRAQIEDSSGAPLLTKSTDYHVGVYPGRLSNPARTAEELGSITGLNAQQVLGHIKAAPPRDFLSLLTLDQTSFRMLWPKLGKVSGLLFEPRSERLFDSESSDVVGTIGTEDSSALHDEGAAYQPGATIGLSGLEQTYQDSLVGTPTTQIVVVNSAGRTVSTLWTAPGQPGTPVRTTIDSRLQAAASSALDAQPDSGEIVAVDSRTGDILALASHQAGGPALPPGGVLNSRLQPGMAFSIVSAAALLGDGIQANSPLPCREAAEVGGQTFTYSPTQQPSGTFASDFASGCGTAFATESLRLTSAQLQAMVKSFGIGSDWDLQVSAFSGAASAASDEANLAAQTIGAGGVLVSPLSMAMVAAEVDAGTGHAPVLIASDPAATRQAPLSGQELNQLRALMRQAVQSGSASAANVYGQSVYGQAGVVQTGPHAWLSWFVGYEGTTAITALETGSTSTQAAASLAGSFLSAAR